MVEVILNQAWSSLKELPAGPRWGTSPLKLWGLGLGRVPGAPITPPGRPRARDALSQQSPCWGCPEAPTRARGSLGLTGQADPGLPEPRSLTM